jgi:hypothetical protein
MSSCPELDALATRIGLSAALAAAKAWIEASDLPRVRAPLTRCNALGGPPSPARTLSAPVSPHSPTAPVPATSRLTPLVLAHNPDLPVDSGEATPLPSTLIRLADGTWVPQDHYPLDPTSSPTASGKPVVKGGGLSPLLIGSIAAANDMLLAEHYKRPDYTRRAAQSVDALEQLITKAQDAEAVKIAATSDVADYRRRLTAL